MNEKSSDEQITQGIQVENNEINQRNQIPPLNQPNSLFNEYFSSQLLIDQPSRTDRNMSLSKGKESLQSNKSSLSPYRTEVNFFSKPSTTSQYGIRLQKEDLNTLSKIQSSYVISPLEDNFKTVGHQTWRSTNNNISDPLTEIQFLRKTIDQQQKIIQFLTNSLHDQSEMINFLNKSVLQIKQENHQLTQQLRTIENQRNRQRIVKSIEENNEQIKDDNLNNKKVIRDSNSNTSSNINPTNKNLMTISKSLTQKQNIQQNEANQAQIEHQQQQQSPTTTKAFGKSTQLNISIIKSKMGDLIEQYHLSKDNILFGNILKVNYDAEALQQDFQNCLPTQLSESIGNEAQFQEYMSVMNQKRLNQLYQGVRSVYRSANKFLDIVIKLKKLIQTFTSVQYNLTANEGFEKIQNDTCLILSCQRTSVFLIDFWKGQLWSKVATGLQNTIRLPLHQGLVGSCIDQGEIVNVLDAYYDDRFNREADKKTGFRTKSVLVIPIKDPHTQTTLGAIQAINKKSFHSHGFSKDDEGIGEILSIIAYSILSNSIFVDEKEGFLNTTRKLFINGMDLIHCKTKEEFMIMGEKIIMMLLDSQQAHLFFMDGDRLYRFDQDKKSMIYVDKQKGLLGRAFQSGKHIIVNNTFSNPDYDLQADIQTHLTLETLPVFFQPSIYLDKQIIGIIQCINPNLKFQQDHINQNNPQSIQFKSEALEYASHMIGLLSNYLDINVFNQNI